MDPVLLMIDTIKRTVMILDPLSAGLNEKDLLRSMTRKYLAHRGLVDEKDISGTDSSDEPKNWSFIFRVYETKMHPSGSPLP